MKDLIINSANSNLIVLLNCDGKITYLNEQTIKKHNEVILSLIDNLLKSAGIELKDIDRYGVVVGPGSFTGIRVGIATIKAFRDVFNKPAKSINNLQFLSEIGSKLGVEIFAIEGSLNSFFVAEIINDKLYIYPRNLSCDEVEKLANGRCVGVFQLTEQMKDTKIKFQQLSFDENALVHAFEISEDERLLPVYYQLSQAEEEKIKNSELKIEQLELTDFDEILSIEQENFSYGVTGDLPINLDNLNNIYRNAMPNYVAKIDGKLVGYIFLEKTDEINISRIAVKKEYQNHGIATKLIEFAKSEANKEGLKLSIEVSDNNITALKLYKKMGFKLRRLRKNYYADGSDCMEMTLD